MEENSKKIISMFFIPYIIGLFFFKDILIILKDAINTGKIESTFGGCHLGRFVSCEGPVYHTIDYFPSLNFNMTFTMYISLISLTIIITLAGIIYFYKKRNGKKININKFFEKMFFIYAIIFSIFLFGSLILGAIYA